MTGKGSSWPLLRPASLAGRIAFLVVAVVVGLPVWLAIVAGITVFALLRPLLTLITGVVFVGGIAVAGYFAIVGPVSEAIRAVLLTVLSGAALAVVTALSDRLGLDDRASYPVPPWWWFV